MPKKRFVEEIRGFSGGLYDMHLQTPGAVTYFGSLTFGGKDAWIGLENVLLMADGLSVTSRYGTQRLESTTPFGAPDAHVVIEALDRYWAFSDGNATKGAYFTTSLSVPVTWTQVTGTAPGIGGDPIIAAVEFKDASNPAIYYFTRNAINDVGKIVGTVSSVFSGAHLGGAWRTAAVYNQRLWAASESAVYFSGLNNGDTLGDTANGGGKINIVKTEAGVVTALLPVADSLLIVRENGIDVLTGWSIDDIAIDNNLVNRAVQIGAFSASGCIVVGNLAYIAGKHGMFVADATGAVERISDDIWYHPVPASAGPTQSFPVHASYDPVGENILWTNLRLDSSNISRVLVYNLQHKAFTTWWPLFTPNAVDRVFRVGTKQLFYSDDDGHFRIYDPDTPRYLDDIGTNGLGGNSYIVTLSKQVQPRPSKSTKSIRCGYIMGFFQGLTNGMLFQIDTPDTTTSIGTLSSDALTLTRTPLRYGVASTGREFSVTMQWSSSSGTTNRPIWTGLALEGFILGDRY